jgi:hypothetical protein
MVQDGNKLVVFGSQLIGVVIVIVGLLNQQSELHSPRPPGSKTQVGAMPDASGNRFARLWEDPLEDLRTFERVSSQPSSSPSPTASASPSQQASASPAPPRQADASPTPPDIPGEGPDAERNAAQTKNGVTPAQPPTPQRPETGNTPAPPVATIRAPPIEQNQARRLQVAPTSPTPLPTGAGPTGSPTPPPTVKYIFFWNILDARPIPDEIERRLRIRYAIVSAVEAAGYLPYRESVLVPINVDTEKDPKNAASTKLIGYFETFSAIDAKAGFQRVCLIWTPKQYDIDRDTIKTVTDQIGKLDDVTPGHHVRILHYGTSDDLDYYLKKPKDFGPESEISFMRATMPIPSPSPAPSPSLRPIVTDDVLVGRLADELKLRIPALNVECTDPAKKPSDKNPDPLCPRIVIFTESNTKYSREIASELKKQLPNTRQEVYTYLRGLDGRSDDIRSTTAPENSKPDVVASILQGRAISETSFGTSQFDYLRRQALRLEGRKSRDRKNQVAAVGILGSDIYDKMLVLQAVRPELPSAIFFTTDLDALYLEREMQPFTRNLVVASADDLDANRGQAGAYWRLPPMRDSYQSVLVKEVQKILIPPTKPDGTPETGHVYEIAPGKSIDLDRGNQGKAELNRSESLLRWLAPWWASIVVFVIGLANAFLILWAISTRGDENNKPGEQSTRHAAMKTWAVVLISLEISLACIGLFFLLYQLWWSDATLLWGEPLNLGVSIWPSVMIRLLAFIVAIVLLVIASHSFIVYGTLEKEKLEGALPKELTFSHRTGWKRVPATKTFHALLAELVSQRGRKWRIIAASVVYLLVSFFLFWTWPPTVPGRGGWSLLIEKFVLAFGVSLYIIHLIFCIDLHYSALKLLRALSTCQAPGAGQPPDVGINTPAIFAPLGTLTSVIGRTLLYPLTVLILIILSRLRLFDNWVMTPSLTVTFALGALLLVAASLVLWLEGAQLKNAVLAQTKDDPATTEKIQKINDGVFAAWYNQPIFSAILSAAAVFGSLTVAGPIARLFFGYF